MNTERILKQLIEDIDLAIIKAKAQLEYVDDDEIMRLGMEENE
tara:strand:+ start:348 stop:476 length:129 start_codon:yes stop_codon:yes gene_type:complete